MSNEPQTSSRRDPQADDTRESSRIPRSMEGPPSDGRSDASGQEGGVSGANDRSVADLETLGPDNIQDPTVDSNSYASDSTDAVDVVEASEKGTFFWITIGLTYKAQAITNDGKPIPQWGIGLFFDHSYIAIRFKDPVKNSQGIWYRPEMRFWSKEDAVAFAVSIAGKFRFKLDSNVFGSSVISGSDIDPISQALEYVKDAGMKVNNLFQDSEGKWRCSMKQEDYFDFGEGSNAIEAIEAAMHNTSTMSQLSYSAAKKKRR